MGVNAAWQGERGDTLESLLDPSGLLMKGLNASDLSRTACARFIDPYGDAVFNQAQIPILIAEILNVTASERDPDVRKHFEQVVALLRRAVGEVHTYIKFIGD